MQFEASELFIETNPNAAGLFTLGVSSRDLFLWQKF